MKKTIYLAGGFYANNWQTIVQQALEGFDVDFLNPKEKERGEETSEIQKQIFSSPNVYTFWDLNAIERSDIVFVFIDKDNPAIGSLVELGYAKGLCKTVITVIERGREDVQQSKDRYFDFARYTAHVNFDELQQGIEFLKTILNK